MKRKLINLNKYIISNKYEIATKSMLAISLVLLIFIVIPGILNTDREFLKNVIDIATIPNIKLLLDLISHL